MRIVLGPAGLLVAQSWCTAVLLSPVFAFLPALATLLIVAAILVAPVGVETHTFAAQRHEIRHASHHG